MHIQYGMLRGTHKGFDQGDEINNGCISSLMEVAEEQSMITTDHTYSTAQ